MTTQDVALPVPKHIEIAGHKIRFRLPQSIAWGYVATTLAVAVVAALYYLVLEHRWTVAGHQVMYLKPWWDGLFTQDWWTNYRHGIRDVGEGVLAAMAVRTFITNSWKKDPDRRLSGVALGFRVILVLVASLAAIIFGVWVLNYSGPWLWHHITFLKHHSVVPHPTAWVGTATSGVKVGSFVLGFAVTHLVTRKLWEPVGNTISLSLLEGAVSRARQRQVTPSWVALPLAPPAVRERFAYINQTTPEQLKPSGDVVTKILTWVTLLCVPLAGYGLYVLHWIAKGH